MTISFQNGKVNRPHDKNGFADPYAHQCAIRLEGHLVIRSVLFCSYARVKQHGDLTWAFKTTVQKKTLEPAWNEDHSATVSLKAGKENEFVLELWDQDSLVDDAIGKGHFSIHPKDSDYGVIEEDVSVNVTKGAVEEATVRLHVSLREIIKEPDTPSNPLYNADSSRQNPLFTDSI